MARTVLDLDHITAVCDRLSQTRVAVGLTITPTRRGYAIDTRSAASARRVQAAFTQLGYRANLPERYGRKDQVTITGWNRPALETRITALHQAIARLSDSRDRTAADVIENGIPSRGELHDTLRAAVERDAGIITNPMAPIVGDHDCTQLLETARQLEREALAQIRRHVQTAEVAVDLYRQYRPGIPDDQARAYAITAAESHAPPPGELNQADAAKRHHPATTANTAAPAAGDGPVLSLDKRLDDPRPTAEAIETPDGHPAAIAAHDHPDGTRIDIAPGTPPPPVIPQRAGPIRGPAAR